MDDNKLDKKLDTLLLMCEGIMLHQTYILSGIASNSQTQRILDINKDYFDKAMKHYKEISEVLRELKER